MIQPTVEVRVAASVPADLAERLRLLAESRERSVAAEIRLAIRSHVDAEASNVKASA